MAYDIGFNFRETSGYVTDPANTTYCIGDAYPTTRAMVTSGLNVTFGWDSDLVTLNFRRDRDSGIDARLAGLNFCNSTATGDFIFRVNLPEAGACQVHLAAGDATGAENASWQIIDSDATTVLVTQAVTSVSSANWRDASQVNRTSASDWVSNNASINVTFSGTVAYFKLVAESPPSVISHLRLYKASSGQTVTSVTGSNITEASSIVFDVAMAGSGDSTHAYAWGGTATGADYTSTITTLMCSVVTGTGTVTVTGSNVFVPGTATAIRINVPTTTDALDENGETVTLTLGGTVSNTVTIADDDAEPSITGTTSVTVDAGDPVVITYTLSAVSGRTITRALTVTDGTATGGGTDYTSTIDDTMFATTSGTGTVTISGSTVTIPAGVLVFTLTIPTTA